MGIGMLQLPKKLTNAEGDTGERSRKRSFHNKEKPEEEEDILVNHDKNYDEALNEITKKTAKLPKQMVQNKPLIDIGNSTSH